MSLSPTCVTQQLSPAPTEIPSNFALACKPPEPIEGVSPGFDLLAQTLASDVTCYTNYNAWLIQINAAPPNVQNLFTITWFYSVAATPGGTVDSLGNPIGSLYELIAQDGPAAYVPPAPPVVVMGVTIGIPRPLSVYSDGLEHPSWTGYGTYPPGQLFQNVGSNVKLLNPTLAAPTPGNYLELINGYMAPGGVVVDMGPNPTAPLPVNG